MSPCFLFIVINFKFETSLISNFASFNIYNWNNDKNKKIQFKKKIVIINLWIFFYFLKINQNGESNYKMLGYYR